MQAKTEYNIVQRQNCGTHKSNGKTKLYQYLHRFRRKDTGGSFMNCCMQNNNCSIWILVALVVLCSKDGFSTCGLLNGCGLPIIIALLYCLYKNGTLSSLLTPQCCNPCC